MKNPSPIGLLFILVLALTACERSESSKHSAAQSALQGGVYTQDPRTGLCFFYRYFDGDGETLLANVPCTPEVLAQVRRLDKK